jgi:hypothetical protein
VGNFSDQFFLTRHNTPPRPLAYTLLYSHFMDDLKEKITCDHREISTSCISA